MNRQTANNIIQAISRFRQYLFVNEWNKICECINFYVDDKKPQGNAQEHNRENKIDEPPLRALWNALWEKKANLPYAFLVIIFFIGFAIGKWVF